MEQIQDYAVQAVAAGLNVIPGVNCPPTPCQAALEMGLEVALATMGVPPSIPNFDQLMDQGFDYAAAQLASQVGVPSVIADVASDEARSSSSRPCRICRAGRTAFRSSRRGWCPTFVSTQPC
ncbi:MAG: hypothetical protein IPL75_16120 [Acidobacteria bacterium]|nr:hypothetical protein [Acidobacteriota bacterium]